MQQKNLIFKSLSILFFTGIFFISVCKADADTDNKLFIAAQKGDITTVSDLIKAGIKPNIQDKNGYTALIFASQNGYKEIVDMLLKAGADPNLTKAYHAGALYYATPEIADMLIKAGAKK